MGGVLEVPDEDAVYIRGLQLRRHIHAKYRGGENTDTMTRSMSQSLSQTMNESMSRTQLGMSLADSLTMSGTFNLTTARRDMRVGSDVGNETGNMMTMAVHTLNQHGALSSSMPLLPPRQAHSTPMTSSLQASPSPTDATSPPPPLQPTHITAIPPSRDSGNSTQQAVDPLISSSSSLPASASSSPPTFPEALEQGYCAGCGDVAAGSGTPTLTIKPAPSAAAGSAPLLFHSQCFTCLICNQPLNGTKFLRLPSTAYKAVRQKCLGSNVSMQGRPRAVSGIGKEDRFACRECITNLDKK